MKCLSGRRDTAEELVIALRAKRKLCSPWGRWEGELERQRGSALAHRVEVKSGQLESELQIHHILPDIAVLAQRFLSNWHGEKAVPGEDWTLLY